MELLDWAIFLIYLVFVFAIGVWVSKKSGEGINSYFVADRSLPWWWLGISIIATTFAADTPLAITGITASSGIAGNWLWWSWAATYITVSVFFAKRWRMSNVLTDVEFIELRYSGKEAAFLRGFKAFFYGVILNVFILGWVITAAVKIANPFIDWEVILGDSIFQSIESIYPSFLLFKDDLNATITIMSLLLIVMIYSSIGGIRGVEIGTVLADRDPFTRKNRFPELELVRLAIPRRTYTNNHMDFIAVALKNIYDSRSEAKSGYEIIDEAPIMRHFTVKFDKI